MSIEQMSTFRLDVDGRSMFARVRDGTPSIQDDPAAPDSSRQAALPIVLVHGAVISGRYMVPTAVRLPDAHQVLVPDLPGFGASEDPPAPLDVPGLARALAAWMKAAGIHRAHLLGNSMGAQVIVDLAVREPRLVESLVLVGPTVDRAARTRLEQLWRLATDAFRERPSLIPLHLRDIMRAGWRFATSALEIALDDRIEAKLPHVEAKVLVVCGDRDPLAPEPWCRWLAAQRPDTPLQMIAGPHALNYSRPDALARCVSRWIESGDGANRATPSSR